jgi:hypothetical protein
MMPFKGQTSWAKIRGGASPKLSNKSRLLKFCYAPATSAYSSKGIFAVATNSTNQKNKACGTCHLSVNF